MDKVVAVVASKTRECRKVGLEEPARIDAAVKYLGNVEEVTDVADVEEVKKVHSEQYLRRLKRAMKGSDRQIKIRDKDLTAALNGIAAAKVVADYVKRGSIAILIARPPGHRVGVSFTDGKGIFNYGAYIAQELSSDGTVAVVDIDLHPGEGTHDIFFERNDVLTISIHEKSESRMSDIDVIGKKDGEGYHINIPLPPGITTVLYMRVLERGVLPILEDYAPKYIVIQAGFDTHIQDPLGDFLLTLEAYYEIGRRIREVADKVGAKGIAVTLEGGYNLDILGKALKNLLDGITKENEPTFVEGRRIRAADHVSGRIVNIAMKAYKIFAQHHAMNMLRRSR